MSGRAVGKEAEAGGESVAEGREGSGSAAPRPGQAKDSATASFVRQASLTRVCGQPRFVDY